MSIICGCVFLAVVNDNFITNLDSGQAKTKSETKTKAEAENKTENENKTKTKARNVTNTEPDVKID